jgi:hypothetical protein
MRGYGMFSVSGNSAVAKIVECAETAMLSWPVVESMLEALSTDERYAEATDTEVRETVYCDLFGA